MTGRARSLGPAAVDAAVIAALVVVASLAFGGAYGGTRWLIAVAGGAVIGAAAALLAARLRRPWWGTVLAALLGYLAFGAALAVPSTAIGGVVPSAESLRLLTLGVSTSWQQLLTVAVPVGTSGALMIPAYLTALATAAVGTSIAVRTRRPAWALTAPLAMLLVAALFGSATPWLPVVAGLGVAVGGLTWASWRTRTAGSGLDLRRPLSAVVVLAAAASAGLYLGPQLDVGERYALRETVQPPFDPQQYPSPLVGFRKYFKEQRKADLFTVTGLPAGGRIRLAALDDYNGVTYATSGTVDPFRKVGDHITDDQAAPGSTAAAVDVTIEDYRGVFLPIGGNLTGLTFDAGDRTRLQDAFRYSPGNATGVVVTGLSAGDAYRSDVLITPPAAELNLGSTPFEKVTLPAPGKIPDEVKTLAGTLSEPAGTPYEKVAAIQKGLADQGFLSHGTQGEEPSASGHGLDRLSALVGDRALVGDQEQFAPTMALMLRSLGIPARVVMGFAPPTGPAAADGNDPSAPAGAGGWTVQGADATAWVEVPFQGVGWVAFDPTPDDQRTEQEPDPQPEVAPRAQVLQPPPPPQPPQEVATDDVDRSSGDQDQGNTADDDQADSGALLRTILLVTAWVGIPLLLIGGPIALILWLKARRRRRRQEEAVVADRFAGGWDQIMDVATDLGYSGDRGRTRAETAADLDDAFGGSTVLLARRADARVFGPEDLDDVDARLFWADVDAAALGLSAGRSRWRRGLAAVSLRSLRRRRGGRP
ncbi:transglutaminase family protein [Nakamurella sp.]|uniref:transglutaminase family protein n=1 Tax=Nakamurella sp. TaxID=1869182 RepID=UPI003784AC69